MQPAAVGAAARDGARRRGEFGGPLPPWPRRAVVTGGAGFLGSHLCQALLDGGSEVVSLDDFSTGSPVNLASMATDARFRSLRRDVRREVRVPGPVDLVLHLAAPVPARDRPPPSAIAPATGVSGTRQALDLARRTAARFVLVSGLRADAAPGAEALASAYRSAYGVDAGVVRVLSTYGPRMRLHDSRVVPTFLRQALAGRPLTVVGDGLQTRSLCYVDDLVDAVMAMAVSSAPGPMVIGSQEDLTVLRIAQDVLTVTGSTSQLTFVPGPTGDPPSWRPDSTQAQRVLGWRAVVPWHQGLRSTMAWFTGTATGQGTRGTPSAPR